jgi:hypothetical protein
MIKTTVFGIKLKHRMKNSLGLQEVLTEFGCNVKTRIGLHHVTDGVCSPDGIILLEVIGDDSTIESFEAKIKAISGAELQKMSFSMDQ